MSHLIQALMLLSLAIATAKLAGAAAIRLGQSATLGELLAGLLLGPTLLNVMAWPAFSGAAAEHSVQGTVPLFGLVNDLADVGVILLMLVAGLETDLDQLWRFSTTAFWSAAGGVILALVGGIVLATTFQMPVLWTGVFLGTILAATSVSITSQVLMDLGVVRSKEATTILGAAVIDDVLGIIVLSVVVAFSRVTGAWFVGELGLIIARIMFFVALAAFAGRYFERILAWVDSLQVKQGLPTVVILLGFVYASAAEYIGGVAAITGSFVAGVFLARTSFKKRIDEGVHPLAYSLLVPLFFIMIGLKANARTLGAHPLFTLTFIFVAILGKIVGCGAPARLCGFSNRESLRVGLGMISRGEVGLIVAGYGLSQRLIGEDVFSASVLMVLGTTLMTPPLLRLVYPKASTIPLVPVEEAFIVAGSVADTLESSDF